ncbi:hypothetical protein D9M69_646620 [compost metagenome]
MVVVALSALGAGVHAVEAEDHVVGHQLTLGHYARFGGKLHTLAQLDLKRQRGGPSPSLGQFTAHGIGGLPTADGERVLTATALSLGQVNREQLLIELTSVTGLQRGLPIGQVP